MLRIYLASLLALSSACSTDDELGMPTDEGTVDGDTLVDGSRIPSGFAEIGKQYLTGRRIDTLEHVGALVGAADRLAKRVDGMIVGMPANGRYEAAELEQIEEPDVFATLAADEQAALPLLWRLLEAPAAAFPVNAVSTDLTVTDARTEPHGLIMPASLAISSLISAYQPVASHVETLFDADGNASTIAMTDVDKALAMPQAFTQTELASLAAIRATFIERATSDCEAKVIVPEPRTRTATTQLGTMSLTLSAVVKIREERWVAVDEWNATMLLDTHRNGTLTAPAGSQLVGIELDTGAELVLVDGQIFTHDATQYLVERYVDGARQESYLLALPAGATNRTQQDLTAYVDYELVLSDSTPLVKYPVSHGVTTKLVDFEYGVVPKPIYVDPEWLTAVATPPLTIPTGRYAVRLDGLPDATVDVYPGSVMFINGRRTVAALLASSSKVFYLVESTSSTKYFKPSANTLTARWAPSNTTTTTVRASMRTQ